MTATAKQGTEHPEVKSKDSLVCQHTLLKLGYVPNLHSAKARRIGVNSYRVNIWTRDPETDQVVPGLILSHSHYVVVDDGCHIVSADPPIQRQTL